MIDQIIALSLRHKVLVYALVAAITSLGIYSALTLSVDAVPDITNNQVLVITRSPALPATEIEQLVTTPLEIRLSNLPGLTELRSVSKPGLSVVTLVFDDATAVTDARQLVSEQIKSAEELLPPGTTAPELGPIATGLGEVYQYVLEVAPPFKKAYSLDYLRTIQDWNVRRQFAGTPGVIEVNSFGGFERQIEVAADAAVLASYNLTLADLQAALHANNQNQGSAYIEKGPYRYYLGTRGRYVNKEQIAATVIKEVNNVPLTIADVATVVDGAAPRHGAMAMNGEGEVVGGIVMMLKGASSSHTIAAVEERVKQINQTLPPGIRIKAFLDRGSFIQRVINTVRTNLIEGALIVLAVLILFLGSWRSGLIVASVIPLALLFAFTCMKATGIVANLMSLGAIDFGLVVDGSLIIVESIVAHLGYQAVQGVRKQANMDRLVYDSASRIRTSAAFGELIILIVYVPVLLLGGVEGKTFQPMAATICFALAGAFILSLTWVPVASALLLRSVKGESHLAERILHVLQRVYLPVIKGALRRPVLVVAAAVVALGLSLAWFINTGGEFLPQLDEGDYALELRLAPGSSLQETLRVSQIIEKKLNRVPEVRGVVSKIGTSSVPTDPMPPEANDMMVLLDHSKPWTRSKDEIQQELEGILDSIPGIAVEFLQPIQMRFNELMSGVKGDVAILIYGESLPVLTELSFKASAIASTINGAEDIKVEPIITHPQFSFVFDRDALARYQANIADANEVLLGANAGLPAGHVFEGVRRFEVMLRSDSATRQDTAAMNRLLVRTNHEQMVMLGQLGRWQREYLPQQISHEKGRRRVAISLNVRGTTVQEVVNELRRKIAQQMPMPSGYVVEYGGQFENFESARKSLALAVPMALLGIFCLLFISFRSISQSLLIMVCVPLAGVGGAAALALRGMPFSISAGVGFIALFGVAVLNGMVLISSFNNLKDNHPNLMRRVLTAALQRVRPVIMTATVASLGFLPMAFSTSAGAEVQRPLATVVVGGLPVATLLTLVLLPVLYVWLERRNRRPGKGMAAAVMLVGLSLSSAQAQTSPAQRAFSGTEGSVQRLHESALQNNPLLQSRQDQVRAQLQYRKASFSPGKTALEYSYGQTQEQAMDYTFTIGQRLDWPGLYAAQRREASARLNVLETELALNRAELRLQLADLVYQYALALRKIQILQRQDSLLSRAAAAAEARVRVGESAPTLVSTILLKSNEVRAQLAEQRAQLPQILNEVKLLASTDGSITIDSLVMPLHNRNQANQQVALAQARSSLAQYMTRTHRQRALPDFFLGYSNQSVNGVRGLQYITAGLNLALVRQQYRAMTRGAAIEAEAARKVAGFTQSQVENQLQNLQTQRAALLANLQTLQSSSLPHAEANFRRFERALALGSFDLADFALLVMATFDSYQLYFSTVQQLNSTTNQMNFLNGSYNQ